MLVLHQHPRQKQVRMTDTDTSVSKQVVFSPTPEWISKEYIEKSLQEFYQDNQLQIVEFSIKPAAAKGENFAGVLSRVVVKYKTSERKAVQSASYLVKSIVEHDPFTNGKLSDLNVYGREMEIYSKIFPKVQEILRASQIDEELVPQMITTDYPRNSIIFEDLSIRSYVPPDRVKGFDMVHAKMILKKLAILHATTAVLGYNSAGTFQLYDRGLMNRHTNVHDPYYRTSLRYCAEAVAKIPGYEKYAQKMVKLQEMLLEYGNRAFDSMEHRINVLAHGDLWITNTLFKYNAKKEPVDVIIIDFQFSVWSSPTIDLHYFFNTSLQDELVPGGQEELVQFYYESLAGTLRKLDFKGKIPTLKQFWKEFVETSFYGFVSACLVKPYMVNEDASADADLAALLQEDERAVKFKRAVFGNERVHRYLKKLLPIFDRKGLLDVHQ